jgi:DNA-binding MarR family transcriptional regulator
VSNGPRQDEITLGVLSAVEADAEISQRVISHELGMALGLANAYLKRCVRKGWIKVRQVPRRRYAYYLTPQGFAEKTRLTAEYLSVSFTFFRKAREQMSELMAQCAANGWRRIVFAGVSELSHVGRLCAYDLPVELVAIVDRGHAGKRLYGVPVVASLADVERPEAVIVTSLVKPDAVYNAMKREMDAERVLTPRLLRLAVPQVAKEKKRAR